MASRRSTKFYRKNEAEVMERLGFKPTKNSGAGWVEKEDGQNDYCIAQLKSTDKKSISIKLQDWHTLEYHAAVTHKIPVFVVQFLSTDDIYIMVKPEDLPNVSQYINCGECKVVEPTVVIDEQKTENSEAPKIASSSKAKQKFWKEKERENEKWQKKLKSNR